MIDAKGSVGIGTMNPQAKLEVAGQSKFDDLIAVNRVGSVGAQPGINFYSNDALLGTLSYFQESAGNGGFRIYTNNLGTNQESFRVSANGNVGIGTASPSQKLVVAGNIASSGAIYSTDFPNYGQVSLHTWGLNSVGDVYIEPASGRILYLTPSWSNSGSLEISFPTTHTTGNLNVDGDLNVNGKVTGANKYCHVVYGNQILGQGGLGHTYSSGSIATCPANEQIMGGACEVAGAGYLGTASRLSGNTYGCIFSGSGSTPGSDYVTAQAICCPA